MQKKVFIKPQIQTEEVRLNLFSSYDNSYGGEGFLMNEVYAASNSLYLPIIFSDKNLKESVTPLTRSISTLMKLQPVSYKWKGTQKRSVGLIAQHVKDILPEAVIEKSGIHRIDYAGVVSLLIQAVQDQQKEINTLKKRLNDIS